MNFFKNILQLIVSPTEGWKSIKKFNVPRPLFTSKVFFPLLGVLAVSVFVQYLYTFTGSLTDYLQKSIIQCSSIYFGYMLSAFALNYYLLKGESEEGTENKVHIFTLYLYSILMMLSIINNLLPVSFPFIDIFHFYVVYLIFKGVDYLSIKSGDRVKFVVVASLALLLSFYAIRYLLNTILL